MIFTLQLFKISMANDWIKMRMNLADDPAVIGIAARLKLDRFAVVGRLHTLWSWADEHSADGFLPHITAEVIDAKVDKRGFAAVMAAPGVAWLIISADGVTFPKFDRHNGASAKKRALDMDRKRVTRGREAGAAPPSVAGVSASQADTTRTREEKRRERHVVGGGSTDRTERPAEPAAGARPHHDRLVDDSILSELQARFPLVDVAREREKALAYARQQRGPAAELELRFFAEDWLPKAPVRSEAHQARHEAKTKAESTGEPEGWQAWMDEHFPDWVYATGREPGAQPWTRHSPMNQKFVRDSMARGGAK